MERMGAICAHPRWRESFDRLQILEQDRPFCRHTMEHFLDVARIANIENLERGLGIPKALIYAAALLHDIGRAAQYQSGTPHEEAGAGLAREIMGDCGFSGEEQAQVAEAILGHRNKNSREGDSLTGLLYRADKASRLCLMCPAEKDCNWDKQKKNMTVRV